MHCLCSRFLLFFDLVALRYCLILSHYRLHLYLVLEAEALIEAEAPTTILFEAAELIEATSLIKAVVLLSSVWPQQI